MSPENLPPWVVQLVAGLARYEHEHPTLYAQYAGSDEWQKADCPGMLLNLVPGDVQVFAAGWWAALSHAETVKAEATDTTPHHDGEVKAP